jgi:hypothetical protein
MVEEAIRDLKRDLSAHYVSIVTGDTLVVVQRITEGDRDLIVVNDCKLRRRAEFPE